MPSPPPHHLQLASPHSVLRPFNSSSSPSSSPASSQTQSQSQSQPHTQKQTHSRLSQLAAHMAAPTGVFTAANVPQAPEDPLFGLMRAYRQDPSEKKVDLGIGAYRDDNAKPWILPVVRKVFSLSLSLSLSLYRGILLTTSFE